MTVNAPAASDIGATGQRNPPPGLRMLAALGVATLMNAGLLLLGPGIVTAMLFVPLVGLPSALLLLAAIGFITGGLLKLATGTRAVLPGVLAAAAAALAGIVLFIRTPEIPMHWVGSVDIGMLPAAAVATAAAAVALPRWWVKLIGGCVLVITIGLVAVPQIVSAFGQQAIIAEQDRLAAEQYLAAQERPVTTEWTGAHSIGVSAGESSARAYLISDGGGALEITVYGDEFSRSESHSLGEVACWSMGQLGGALDDTVTMERYQGICEAVESDSWRLVDGSAVATMFEGRLVIVDSPPESSRTDLGATRAATSDELTAAAAQLRTLTLDEVREAKTPSTG